MYVKNRFRLNHEDIQPQNEDALELFYSGIKSIHTKSSFDKNLKQFLNEVCADILQGTYPERANQFVKITTDDQKKATQMILAYIKHLRSRSALDRMDPDYLNPSSIPNRIKPIKKLLEMNGLGLGWKRIHSTYPDANNTNSGRGYTRQEIKILLEHSTNFADDFVILASSSGGLRVGAWHNMTWGCLVYRIDAGDRYAVSPSYENPVIVCAAMTIYKGTSDEYDAIISKEAWDKLAQYRVEWTKKIGKEPKESDSLFLGRSRKPVPLTFGGVKTRIEKLVARSGIRSPLVEGKRRHEVPSTHGFRRFWDKVMMEAARNSDKLSALVKKERLLGHGGLVKTDKNYYWTNVLDLVPDYLSAMPELTINDEERLQKKLESERIRTTMLEKANQEKEIALERLKELEAKVERMQKYQIKSL